jgi:hypothetical protein
MAGVTGQQGMLTPNPTIAFVVGTCCPTFDCSCLLDYDYVWHIVIFAILYTVYILFCYRVLPPRVMLDV